MEKKAETLCCTAVADHSKDVQTIVSHLFVRLALLIYLRVKI